MIKCIKIERAAALWVIDEHEVTLAHRNSIEIDKLKHEIRIYLNSLKNKSYINDNAVLCHAFLFFGGISFVNIGHTVVKDEFLDMFRYYAKMFAFRWMKSEKTIHSKNIGIKYVFEIMLQHQEFAINYNFTYILNEIAQSDVFVNIVNNEFIAVWTGIITEAMALGKSLQDITQRIGLVKVYACCMAVEELTKNYFRMIAAAFTNRREVISELRLQHEIFGRKMDYGLYPEFWELLHDVVTAEYEIQCGKFVLENRLQFNMNCDIWLLYQLQGTTLKCNKMDFSIMSKPFIKRELKSYIKYRFSGKINIKDRCLNQIIQAINEIIKNNPEIECIADIDEIDIKMLFDILETSQKSLRRNNKKPTNTMYVFSNCKSFIRYLMSDMREMDLKTPVPRKNIFGEYTFVNSKDYVENTEIIPEEVLLSLERHMHELPMPYRLIFKIFIHTGLRAKEVLLLENRCVEPSKYENTVQLKFKPYKILTSRRKAGIGDYHRLPIPTELGNEITDFAGATEGFRSMTDLPYVFLKRKGKRIVLPEISYLSVLVDKLINKHNICDEHGRLWHFTSRQCRKTIAVTLIENGASADEVAYWLGHLSRNTTMKYYADVRKIKLAQMNTKFFRDKFEILLSKEQLADFSEEERRLLYVDFCLEQRRVEFGYCLRKIADGGCTYRNSIYNCVNCKNLCTGKKYLLYWEELLEQQNNIVEQLLQVYENDNISEYMEYKEYKQEMFLFHCYQNIVTAIKNARSEDE